MTRIRNTSTSTASSAAYHIVFKDGQYKVFDKAGRFRVGFATLPAAQTYIVQRSGAPSHNKALSDEGQTAVLCVIERQGKLFGE